MKKTYTIRVTETYISDYEVEAEDEDEAIDIADSIASDDMELATPENMTDRDFEVVTNE